MKLEYGFCEFYGKDDKALRKDKDREGRVDLFGLRQMNNQISNILFPECTTLMPNLEYLYYLNAIYHVLKNSKNNQEPEKREIDYYEKIISQFVIRHTKERERIGLFDTAEKRAYGKYKTTMKLLFYFDADWMPVVVREKENQKMQQQILQATPRYKFVEAVIGLTNNNQNISFDSLDKLLEENPDSEVKKAYDNCHPYLVALDETEKMDYIRRVLENKSPENQLCPFSFMTNLIMGYLGLKGMPGENDDIYKCNKLEEYITKKEREGNMIELKPDIYSFKELLDTNKTGLSLTGICKKTSVQNETLYDLNMTEYLRQAQIYSCLQEIARIVYNLQLRMTSDQGKENREKKYRDELKKKVGWFYRNVVDAENEGKKDYWYWKRKTPFADCKAFMKQMNSNEAEPKLKACWDFIYGIDDLVRKSISKPHDTDDTHKKMYDEIIKNIENYLEDKVSVIGGNEQNYIDTFRWEYRPSIITDKAKKADSSKRPASTMCAQYYIWELFGRGVRGNENE